VKLIAGLGNPGVQYQFNRHNMGFLVLDRLAETEEISISQNRFDACFGKGILSGHPVVLVKPQTYMNLSGISLRKIFDYFRIALEDVIVVHDDLDLPFGTIRLKAGGGPGGHKGLISIIEHLGAADFNRFRLGIGKPVRKEMVESYVLSAFSPDEMNRLPEVLTKAAEMLAEMVSTGIQSTMCKYHGKTINNFEEV
jgi:peptidyl-tRNA hydrolase, PTH1 family